MAFSILEEKLHIIIHDMIRVIHVLKGVESEDLTKEQKQTIHNCESRLMEIRQELLVSIIDEDKEKEK